MTTRIPLLLAALLATPFPRAQAAPQAEPEAFTKTSASDRARFDKLMAQTIQAYRSLRSYSGRFYKAHGVRDYTQTGTIQFARPNRLAMRVQVKEGARRYTRRIVSDGTFLWKLDSRFKNRYTKEKVRLGRDRDRLGAMIGDERESSNMNLCSLLEGEVPPGAYGPLRITSPPQSPVLTLDVFTMVSGDWKWAFRIDPTNHLLRGSTSRAPTEPRPEFERHWDIRLNPTLPDSTFRFKPAPHDRQIDYFDTFGLPGARLSTPQVLAEPQLKLKIRCVETL